MIQRFMARIFGRKGTEMADMQNDEMMDDSADEMTDDTAADVPADDVAPEPEPAPEPATPLVPAASVADLVRDGSDAVLTALGNVRIGEMDAVDAQHSVEDAEEALAAAKERLADVDGDQADRLRAAKAKVDAQVERLTRLLVRLGEKIDALS